MDTLRELANALNQHHSGSIKVVMKNQQPATKISQLYEGIRKGELSSDEDAMAKIFGTPDAKQMYRNLKSDLRDRIYNTLLFIDPKEFKVNHDSNRLIIECYRKWLASKTANSIGAKKASVKLGQKVLKDAEKVGITHLIVEITMFLRSYYATLGDRKQYECYNKLHHEHFEIMVWENKAQEYYTMLSLFYSEGKVDLNVIHEHATSYYLEIKDALYKHKTYKLIFFGGFIKLVMHMSKGEYNMAIDVCDEIISLLNTNPLFPTQTRAIFYTQQMICCIQLKHFDKGEQLAKAAMQFLKPGLFNWFKYQELFFLLSMHSQKYQRAYEVMQETKSTKGLNDLDPKSKEIWIIYEMYTNYLIVEKKIAAEKNRSIKIRLGKFLNEVPAYSKEKRGLNIPILIIQVLIYIQQKQYGKAIDRVEALEKYCSRHLKKENDFRSNCFIKMVLELSKCGFQPVAARRKGDTLFQKLKAHPLDVPNQSHSIEIIPYEVLWEVAIGSLDKKGMKCR